MKKLRMIIAIFMMGALFCVGCSKKDNTEAHSDETHQEHSEHDGHNH